MELERVYWLEHGVEGRDHGLFGHTPEDLHRKGLLRLCEAAQR
jgi:hypothetical protein